MLKCEYLLSIINYEVSKFYVFSLEFYLKQVRKSSGKVIKIVFI